MSSTRDTFSVMNTGAQGSYSFLLLQETPFVCSKSQNQGNINSGHCEPSTLPCSSALTTGLASAKPFLTLPDSESTHWNHARPTLWEWPETLQRFSHYHRTPTLDSSCTWILMKTWLPFPQFWNRPLPCIKCSRAASEALATLPVFSSSALGFLTSRWLLFQPLQKVSSEPTSLAFMSHIWSKLPASPCATETLTGAWSHWPWLTALMPSWTPL